ncbi:family 16 glycosylhydrolase [Flammeovirgaceae bacterium SG7u.111]|nr:family 16 glycosylhydrolase [Flammeovirgaceae bacterium SG7u.132]WPO34237.1 family 16 glycosylhydrolase [Flammeovirgaceae bacterium SG7u.111]
MKMYPTSQLKKALLTVVLISLSTLLHADPPEPPVGFRWVLQAAFSDEFNGTKLDQNKWFDHYPGWEGRAPARFEPKALSMKNGNLEIKSGVLDKPKGKYTMYGGGIVSKSSEAHFGYYECRAKASKIAMSTTFWMSNDKVLFTEKGDCANDKYSQELDIQECIGGGTVHQKFRNGMNSNTHYRYIKCGEKKETFFSKGAGTFLNSEVSDEYHTYGAWWKSPEEVEFYADNEFFEMVKVTKEISDKPFDRPMHVNMVTETYNWQPAPSNEDLENDEINTAYYDWVRGYKLVPINEKFDHPISDVAIYKDFITVSDISENIFDTKTLELVYTYSNNENTKIVFKIIEGNKKMVTKQELTVDAYHGFGKATLSLPLSFTPEEGKHYKVEAQLLGKGGKVLDEVRYDVSR